MIVSTARIFLLLTLVLFITTFTSCAKFTKATDTPEDVSISNISTASFASTPVPSTAENTEYIIKSINDRVDWVIEGLGGYPFIGNEYLSLERFTLSDGGAYRDYYDDDILVYRRGEVKYYDKIEGCILYYLYYDKEGRLIYADIVQYRHPYYCIYFYNDKYGDKFIRLITGERTNKEEVFLDELMINAIKLCFENAYE